jgi:hypothetical protein
MALESVIDGDHWVLFGTGLDLLAIAKAMRTGVQYRRAESARLGEVNDPREKAISDQLIVEAQRYLDQVPDARHDVVALPVGQPESLPESRKRISVTKAASIIDVDPKTIYRWIDREVPEVLLMIVSDPDDPLRLDELAVRSYARDHPRSSRRAAA